MPRRRRVSENQSADNMLVGSFLFIGLVVVIGGLASSKTQTTASASRESPGITTNYQTIAPQAAASPPVVYAALPPDPGAKAATGSLFEKPLAEPAPTIAREPASSAIIAKRFISGHKVPLRSRPEVGSAILDRLSPGIAVGVIEEKEAWSRVRDELTQREGWVPNKRLTAEKPAEGDKERAPSIAPTISVAAIAKLLIAESISRYPGPCACPYQSARNGSSCGRRAAYSRPGGYAPLCYAHDITPAMIAEYRMNQSSTVASR